MNKYHKIKIHPISGSITVEAAFVLPIVILTIFALIYLSFYLHDICRIQGVVDLSLHKAGLFVKHEADLATGEVPYGDFEGGRELSLFSRDTEKEKEELKVLLEQELSKGLFLVRVNGIKVSVNRSKLKASVNTKMAVTLPLFSHLFNAMPDKVISEDYPVHDPAEAVRCLEVILDTGAGIKGMDKIMSKLP